MNKQLYDIVVGRLAKDSLPDTVSRSILTACQGSEALANLLGSTEPARAESTESPNQSGAPVRIKGVSLACLTVQGFRGIGGECVLEVQPGPGLTLVVGRNGSGKSSFSEALEMLLTGDNSRWMNRTKIWQDGWKNLHFDGATVIEAEFVAEGENGTIKVNRTWNPGDPLDQSTSWLQRRGKKRQAISDAAWESALANYRPFLPYNELGAMFDAGPARLFDAMSAVLGLGDLVDAQENLRRERLGRERFRKEVKGELPGLLDRLETSPDERAQRALEALKGRTWDLGLLSRIVTGEEEEADEKTDIQVLRQLAGLEPPPKLRIEEHIRELRKTGAELAGFSGSDVERDRRVAELLQETLDLHAAHGEMDCPVCGEGRIDDSWHERTVESLDVLRDRVAAYQVILTAAKAAFEKAREAIHPAPSSLRQGARLGVDTSSGIEAFERWNDLEGVKSPTELADHLKNNYPTLEAALELVREDAAAELEHRQSLWQPVATLLTEWLAKARKAERQADTIHQLKSAEQWLKQASDEIRNQRFKPIAVEVNANWEQLRQQSSVDLQHVGLEGSGTRRRVALDVAVDGIPGVALGVMSQGELHSLALSLFLPRATLTESPFRFVVIDDPVQSMDPARVDGLARVLERCARDRQVLVFTHDGRLVEAIRRLQIDATILEVQRRANSKVEIQVSLDPVDRYLKDATALTSTPDLPPEAARRAVPGFCRMALEAILTQTVRRRRLQKGQTQEELAAELEKAHTLNTLASLAFFDRSDQGGEVLSRINKFGRWAGDVYQDCQRGSHGEFEGDLQVLVERTGSLVKKLQRMA